MLFELIGDYSGKTMTVDSNHFTSSRQRRVEELNLEVCILLTFTSYLNLKGKAKIASNVLRMSHPVCLLLGLLLFWTLEDCFIYLLLAYVEL